MKFLNLFIAAVLIAAAPSVFAQDDAYDRYDRQTYPGYNPGYGHGNRPGNYPGPGYEGGFGPNFGTEDILCESRGFRATVCYGNYLRRIRSAQLIQQTSRASCYGNYGVRNGVLQVWSGCRGYFRVQGRL